MRALLDEELPGDEQCNGESEREYRGRELTGIIHRELLGVRFARETPADHRQFLHI
ncbi:hypothetical protein IVB18_22080 [Bradyrhizobium sp. 186]|uniref:hypothetical protein n=1 Tax=Bradyrhizobium sp. 186 TaxID=2782654 RepID=UPI0020009AE3|nr:hypothetical protein [Bradyrhizobium sp. 186]UPK39671.1 hypothetical protein IVB18_22080 [Bradyrhizobium sp. 186]